jgi:hypothetical protein
LVRPAAQLEGMATDIRETKFGRRLPEMRERLDERFGPNRWPARIVQIVLGAWLILSAFILPHGRFGVPMAWISGLVFIALAIGAGLFSPLRAVLGLVAVWFLLATLFITEPRASLVSNLFVAIFMLLFSFLPAQEVYLFRWRQRHREAHGHA